MWIKPQRSDAGSLRIPPTPVVPNTNILVSAIISSAGKPAAIVNPWLEGKFRLLK
jgi:hypothetical protein